jgi:hypothetical protein
MIAFMAGYGAAMLTRSKFINEWILTPVSARVSIPQVSTPQVSAPQVSADNSNPSELHIRTLQLVEMFRQNLEARTQQIIVNRTSNSFDTINDLAEQSRELYRLHNRILNRQVWFQNVRR